MRAKNDLSFGQAAALWDYSSDTGQIAWKVSPSRGTSAGDPAGCANSSGHWHIQYQGRKYKSHRIAWLLQTGSWPEYEVDHRNRDRGDNRWLNLRAAGPGDNCQNHGKYRNNTSGVTGVFVRGKRIFSQIKVSGKTIRLGSFRDIQSAASAYAAAKAAYHKFHQGEGT